MTQSPRDILQDWLGHSTLVQQTQMPRIKFSKSIKEFWNLESKCFTSFGVEFLRLLVLIFVFIFYNILKFLQILKITLLYKELKNWIKTNEFRLASRVIQISYCYPRFKKYFVISIATAKEQMNLRMFCFKILLLCGN